MQVVLAFIQHKTEFELNNFSIITYKAELKATTIYLDYLELMKIQEIHMMLVH